MSAEEPAPQMTPIESPQMVSTVKLLMLKKGEYTLWSMRMEQYLTNTDYVPPKTAQAILARQRERIAKSILLLAIPDEYQLRFHAINDANTLWAAIKSRFGGNVESKKMQKNVLKQHFENFSVSDTEGLDKAYDRFQKLISLLEVHGVAVSNEDANQKFLRALPSSWNNIALIMRNKEDGSFGSSLNSQNVAFLSAEDTSSSNEVNTANSVSTASSHNSQGQASSSSCIDDLCSHSSRIKKCSSTKKSKGNRMVILGIGQCFDCPRIGLDMGLGYHSYKMRTMRLNDSVYRPTTNKTSASVSQVEARNKDFLTNYQDIDGGFVGLWLKCLEGRVSKEKVNTARQRVVSIVKGNKVTTVKALAGCVWRPKMTDLNNGSKDNSRSFISKRVNYIDPQGRLNGCSRHMTGNKALLTDYQDIYGGFVAFGRITGIGKIRTNKIDFKDVFFVKELKFNLFFVSQICDKKNSVLFTETECLVLSPDFKLIDESQVLLRVPRQNNMYSFDLKNVVPSRDLTCLFAKATIDESKLWHRRLGHVNFKTMNKLVKGNLVRGLPSKTFENDHTCVACQKGKQHKASCKTKLVSSINQPLQMLHMDLFGPTYVRSINHKAYCLVATKSETSRILKKFITEIENQLNHKVKVIRTPQQNGVAERKNRTLIEAARTMLADSLLPTVFWAEAVNTACYVLNRVLVTKPHNKTPYELIIGRAPSISFMRPFGCPVTILNTLDPLGKFDGKAEEGFLVGCSVDRKAFRVFNIETRKVKENLHVNFLENKPNVAGQGPN
ncbi:putative ribonuclease H-like domain-containing protein [Tanacetum coccineum]